MDQFDVIIVGGGHAGCEAAAAAARLGARTALVTHSLATIGAMSCNPAIGGLGKGHLVREIDALDGLMGRAIDRAGIQFRMLNRSKGAAVRGPRAQADRRLYREAMRALLDEQDGLWLVEGAVEDIRRDCAGAASGILLADGREIVAGAVVLTTGTFLGGVIHLGEERWPAGRIDERPSVALADRLRALDLPMGRLKTGTPPRLDGRTIDFQALERQPGDDPPEPFSTLTERIETPQVDCHITWTGVEVHEAIRGSLHRSPIYSGRIEGVGPRYCPSIEDKVVRFADKERHQIFLEPEGLDDPTIYPNGVSTSLPRDVQDEIIRLLPGCSSARILRHGYAIEYDYVDPRALKATLELKALPRLFLAGQINGTTGYEEAAAQGLIAGVNAALAVGGSSDFVLDRADAYAGVMIDDLISRGVSEPYRMFTSRAEYRITLRADNADQRLTPLGLAVGCVGGERARAFEAKMGRLAHWRGRMADLGLTPTQANREGLKVNLDGQWRSAADLLRLPGVTLGRLAAIWSELGAIPAEIAVQLETDAAYAGYLDRQDADIRAFRRDESLTLPTGIDFDSIGSLSAEIRQRLKRAQPRTLGAAARLEGVTPAAVVALLRHVKRADRPAA